MCNPVNIERITLLEREIKDLSSDLKPAIVPWKVLNIVISQNPLNFDRHVFLDKRGVSFEKLLKSVKNTQKISINYLLKGRES